MYSYAGPDSKDAKEIDNSVQEEFNANGNEGIAEVVKKYELIKSGRFVFSKLLRMQHSSAPTTCRGSLKGEVEKAFLAAIPEAE